MPAKKYQILYKKSVDKDLRKLSAQTRKQIAKKIQSLATAIHPIGSVKLRGSNDLHRIRYSNYRIIYRVKDNRLTVLIIKVGHRKEVYRDS